jgi:aspartate/methionine/tyrosine aminotransferase
VTGSRLTEFEEMIVSNNYLDFAVGYPRLTSIRVQWERYKEMVATTEGLPSRQSQQGALRNSVHSLFNGRITDAAVTYSGSVALERTLSALIPADRSTLLVDPGFDIIDSFVRRVTPFPPCYLYLDPFTSHEETVKRLIEKIDRTIGAVVLVSPNNPSGLTLSQDELDQVGEACAAVDAVLIIDHCFILLDPDECHPGIAFDLSDKCRWAAIWDSSKTIEFLGERFGIVSGSFNELAAIRHVLAEIQLELPMSSLVVMARAVDELRSGAYLSELKKLIKGNYEQLSKVCSSVDVKINCPDAGSFALVAIDKQRFGSSEEAARWLLSNKNVGVLPASLFYMSPNSTQSDFVRVSLARPAERFSVMCEAIVALADAL